MEEFFQNVHFLRPEWFWGMAAIAGISVFLFIKRKHKETWHSAISKEILPFLVVRGDRVSNLPGIFFLVVLLFVVLALAGPAWKKIEKPGGQAEASMVILMDASLSMLVEDVPPNRFERSKEKVHDFLKTAPGLPMAVIAYAGTAHLVIPFTNDYNVVKYQVESLSPSIMPIQGTDLSAALKLADSLLKPGQAKNTILVFTDNITPEDYQAISQFHTEKTIIGFVVLGTPSGGPIPIGKGKFLKNEQGNTILPGFDVENLKSAGKLPGVYITLATLDASDVNRLAANIRQHLVFQKDPEKQDDDWQDAGYWLLIPITLMALLWFRRGWMVQWCLLVLMASGMTSCSKEHDRAIIRYEPLPGHWTFIDLWLTRDQQGQRLLDKNRPEQALERFTDPRQKAMIWYRYDSLDKAAALYASLPAAVSYYNLGVIEAELKNWHYAKESFEEALEVDPEFTEARENLELIERIIQENKSAFQAPTGMEDRMSDSSQEDQDLKDMDGETQETEGEKKKQQETGEPANNAAPAQDEIMTPDMDQDMNKKEAMEMVLRQLSDDPAVFLKRKFEFQIVSGKVTKPEIQNKW